MKRLITAALLFASACSPQTAGVRLPTVRVVVSQHGFRLVVIAEVASTDAERHLGLADRPKVPAGTGMLFVFPTLVRSPFTMENTRVGLHILFIRAGRVREIRNLQPCLEAPCPLTTPRDFYDQALEVPFGVLGPLNVGASVEEFGPIPAALQI